MYKHLHLKFMKSLTVFTTQYTYHDTYGVIHHVGLIIVFTMELISYFLLRIYRILLEYIQIIFRASMQQLVVQGWSWVFDIWGFFYSKFKIWVTKSQNTKVLYSDVFAMQTIFSMFKNCWSLFVMFLKKDQQFLSIQKIVRTARKNIGIQNFRVLVFAHSDFELRIKEVLYIRYSRPSLNNQLLHRGSEYYLNIF